MYGYTKTEFQLDTSDQIIRIFDCAKSVEYALGFNRSNICKCCNGHLKTSYGFKWKFQS